MAKPISRTTERSPWVNLESWMKEHELTVRDAYLDNLDDYACTAVTIGIPPREGLFCRGGPSAEGSRPDGFDVFVDVIVVADRGRLRTVLRVPHAAGPEDLEDAIPRSKANYINLDVTLESDGQAVTVADQPGQRCAERLSKGRDFPNYIDVVTHVCNARGRYLWKGERFVRVAPHCKKKRPTGKNPVAAVCGGSLRGCPRPDYDTYSRGPARAHVLATGSFVSPSDEALVVLDTSDEVYGKSGGTVLVRKINAGWLPVGFIDNLLPTTCTSRRGTDGRDRLICLEQPREGGIKSSTPAYVLDFSHERLDSIVTSFCGQGDDIKSATWTDNPNSFDIEVTLARGVLHDVDSCRSEALDPTESIVKLFYTWGSEGYVPSAKTREVLRTFNGAESENFDALPAVTSWPDVHGGVMPRRTLIQFMEIPNCLGW